MKKEVGFYSQFDEWEILMIIDVVLFIGYLVCLVVLCLNSAYPSEFLKSKFKEWDPEHFETRDFMDSAADDKK